MPHLIELYVDTTFLNTMQHKIREKFPKWGPLEHAGFGTFHIVTPHGRLIFTPIERRNIPNQEGRSHEVWGSAKAKKELLSFLLEQDE